MPNLRIPGKNCPIFNSYSSRTASGISFFRIPTKNDYKIKLDEQHCCSYYSCVDGDLKRQIKNRTLHTSRLWPKFFSFLAIGQKFLELLPTLLFNTHRVGNKFHYAGLYLKRTNASLFLICYTLPKLHLPIKSHQSSK